VSASAAVVGSRTGIPASAAKRREAASGVSGAGLQQNQLRHVQIESGSAGLPPLVSDALVRRRDHRLARPATR